MKPKRCFILFYTTILLLFATCRKETALDKLPPATQEGRNTFGCLVNGKAWIPDNGCDWLCPADLKFYYDFDNEGMFDVVAELSVGNRNEVIVFGFYPCNKTGVKKVSTGDVTAAMTYLDRSETECKRDYSSKDSNTSISGTINITRFDLEKGIISGTFEFTLNKHRCETLNITNGRFDGRL